MSVWIVETGLQSDGPPGGRSSSGGGFTDVCAYFWVKKGSRLGRDCVLLSCCLATSKSNPTQPNHTHTHTHTLCIDHTLTCMYTCTDLICVYLCIFIRAHQHKCTLLFCPLGESLEYLSTDWGMWCGDHCCVFQNHDYFLSCLRRKSERTPPHPARPPLSESCCVSADAFMCA